MKMEPEVAVKPRQPSPRGPAVTALKVAWWALAIGVTVPILIGVLRGVFAS